jgi:glycosyltransferase involved in cell wall biosynthesis
MAMRIPVVSTDVSGIPELVDHMHSGLLVSEKNAGALAEAIELLLSRADLRVRFGEAGRAKVMQQFTLEHNVGLVQELLLEAAGGQQSTRQKEIEAVGGAVR